MEMYFRVGSEAEKKERKKSRPENNLLWVYSASL